MHPVNRENQKINNPRNIFNIKSRDYDDNVFIYSPQTNIDPIKNVDRRKTIYAYKLFE